MTPEEEANIFGQRARQYIADRLEHVRREARNSALEEAAKVAETLPYVEYQAGSKAPSIESVQSTLAQAAAAIRGMIK